MGDEQWVDVYHPGSQAGFDQGAFSLKVWSPDIGIRDMTKQFTNHPGATAWGLSDATGTPTVLFSGSTEIGSNQFMVPKGAIWIQLRDPGHYAVVQFTAPKAATYTFKTTWKALGTDSPIICGWDWSKDEGGTTDEDRRWWDYNSYSPESDGVLMTKSEETPLDEGEWIRFSCSHKGTDPVNVMIDVSLTSPAD